MDDSVRDRIDEYLDGVFGGHEDNPEVADLRIEVRHDLLERLDDLTAHGLGGDEAYDAVIASVGDLQEIVTELTGGTPEAKREQAADSDVRADKPNEPEGDASSLGGKPQGSVYTPEDDKGDRRDLPPYYGWRRPYASTWEETIRLGVDAFREQAESFAQAIQDQVASAVGEFTPPWVDENSRRAARAAYNREYSRRNFAASDMRGMSFADQQLGGYKFSSSNLRDCDFTGASLQGSVFQATDLRNSVFDKANLTGATLRMSSMRHTRFDHATLMGTDLSYSDIKGVSFVGADLSGARMSYADLRGASFSDCKMDGADFGYADVRSVVFDGLQLNNVRFDYASLVETSFVGSTLIGVSFRHISRKAVGQMVFRDTQMDRTTYLSLGSNGAPVPDGITVIN